MLLHLHDLSKRFANLLRASHLIPVRPRRKAVEMPGRENVIAESAIL
jgi:hypothetical protein